MAEAEARVASPAFGAVVSFEGRVRETEDGRPISAIVYEAYPAMAERLIARIAAKAEKRWGCRVAALHRVGAVPVGEAAVVVAAAAPHRPEAFAACRAVIDELKETVPIWKADFLWR